MAGRSAQLCRLSALAIGGLAIVSTAAAEAPFPPAVVAQIDAAVEAETRAKNLPGLAVGIWVPGMGEYVAARGVADLETRRPRGIDDPFRIGSITKTAIATVLLQLVEEGRLAKSDPMSNWFPDFPGADRITVDDLLRMRSGIADSWDQAMLSRYYADPLMAVSASDMIALAARDADRSKPPGQETVYTNVNYIILQKIIEAVTGTPAGAVLEERIFAPLGMSASVYPDDSSLPGPLHGYGWDAANGAYEDKTILNPAPVGGAGAMISDLADLRTYASALCTGTLLSPEAQAARLATAPLSGSPDFVRYGEGIATLGEFCGHDGTIMGFSSEMWYLPAEDAVVVINASRLDEDDHSMSTDLLLALTRILFPEHVAW